MRGTDVLPAMEEMTGADVPETSRTFARHIVSKPTGPSVRHRVAGRAAAGDKSRRAITLQIPIVGSGHKTRQLRAGHQFPSATRQATRPPGHWRVCFPEVLCAKPAEPKPPAPVPAPRLLDRKSPRLNSSH